MDGREKKLIKQLILGVLKEASESATHEKLKKKLSSWAREKGFDSDVSELPNGQRPDVLLFDKPSKQLFVGDAKNSSNERATHSSTIGRIDGYISEFARLLGAQKIKGGTIAIATNGNEAAREWVGVLNLLTRLHDIVDSEGNWAEFKIAPLEDDMFVIYW